MRRLVLPPPPDRYDPRYMRQAISEIQRWADELQAETGAWAVSNETETQTLDVSAAGTTGNANVLATLINTLREKGLI